MSGAKCEHVYPYSISEHSSPAALWGLGRRTETAAASVNDEQHFLEGQLQKDSPGKWRQAGNHPRSCNAGRGFRAASQTLLIKVISYSFSSVRPVRQWPLSWYCRGKSWGWANSGDQPRGARPLQAKPRSSVFCSTGARKWPRGTGTRAGQATRGTAAIRSAPNNHSPPVLLTTTVRQCSWQTCVRPRMHWSKNGIFLLPIHPLPQYPCLVLNVCLRRRPPLTHLPQLSPRPPPVEAQTCAKRGVQPPHTDQNHRQVLHGAAMKTQDLRPPLRSPQESVSLNQPPPRAGGVGGWGQDWDNDQPTRAAPDSEGAAPEDCPVSSARRASPDWLFSRRAQRTGLHYHPLTNSSLLGFYTCAVFFIL